MGNVVVVGAQWGDEGKGKLVDWLSEQADTVVRLLRLKGLLEAEDLRVAMMWLREVRVRSLLLGANLPCQATRPTVPVPTAVITRPEWPRSPRKR